MKYLTIALYFTSLFIFAYSAYSQEIPRSELDKFIGIVEIEWPEKPALLPSGKSSLPQLKIIKRQFIQEKRNTLVDSLYQFNQRHRYGPGIFQKAVMLPSHQSELYTLEIPEHQLLITSLHNYGWETSFNVIAFWQIKGENLLLNWVNDDVFQEILGNVRIGQDYLIMPDKSVLLALEGHGGDAGFMNHNLWFMHFEPGKKSLKRLTEKYYGQNIEQEIQTDIPYKFVSVDERPQILFIEQKYKWEKAESGWDKVIIQQDSAYVDVQDLINGKD